MLIKKIIVYKSTVSSCSQRDLNVEDDMEIFMK